MGAGERSCTSGSQHCPTYNNKKEIQLQTMSALTHTVLSLIQSAANKIQKALSSPCSTITISFLAHSHIFN